MTMRSEKHYPAITAIASVLITGWCLWGATPPASSKDLLQAMLNVAAIAAGFIATAQSILVSIDDKEIVRKMKQSKDGHYKNLVSYMNSGIQWSFVLAISCGVAMLLDYSKQPLLVWLASTTWVGILIMSICCWYRVTSTFLTVLIENQ